MFWDRISNVICFSSFETSHRSYARSSIVMASVSTFHDHSATPAAVVAARKCFSCQTGMDTLLEDIRLAPCLCRSRFQPNADLATATSLIADMTTPVAV
jgi:hypothetical protein